MLKQQLESKQHKIDLDELEIALVSLQSNFSMQWASISDSLKSIYLSNFTDVFKRRALQLSLLGILWSEIMSLGVENENIQFVLEEAPYFG